MRKTYAYHKPSQASLDKIAQLRQAYSNLEDLLEELAPKSREFSIAVTELQNSAMWGIKALVCNDPESVIQL